MKLKTLEPNAHYDIVNGKPSAIYKDNDGSYLYRYNIVAENAVKDGENQESQIGWQCRELRIYETPTKSVLKRAIIRSVVDGSAEFNIVNSYNKHVLGIKIDESAVTNYIEYLQFIEDLDAMLVSDLNNI